MSWGSLLSGRSGIAVAGGSAAVAASALLAGWSPRFVVVPVDALVVRMTPGPIVTQAILLLGSGGHLLHILLAVALTVAVLGLLALGGVETARRLDRAVLGGPLAAVAVSIGVVAIARTPLVGLVSGVAAGLAVAGVTGSGAGSQPEPGRRRVLGTLAGAAGLGGLGILTRDRSVPPELADDEGAIEARLSEAAAASLDVASLEPLVSDGFYTVDISPTPPAIGRDGWSLAVTGAVERDLEVDYDDLRGMATQHRFVTLRCVGESLNGRKMDTALWTGTPVAPLLERAGVRSGCECVMLHAADGYYEEFPLGALEPGLLAYGMNRTLLPPRHGAPVRALVPGHWGEVNVKWLTEIEILDEEATGYWEERGWQGTGPVNTVAKLHATERRADGTVVVAGHTYAGTRGVDRVEVSIDGGATWTEASLSDPLADDDVWRQWAHRFEPSGTHEVVVRAVDGTGTVQPREREDAFPSGPTGWVSKTIRE